MNIHDLGVINRLILSALESKLKSCVREKVYVKSVLLKISTMYISLEIDVYGPTGKLVHFIDSMANKDSVIRDDGEVDFIAVEKFLNHIVRTFVPED